MRERERSNSRHMSASSLRSSYSSSNNVFTNLTATGEIVASADSRGDGGDATQILSTSSLSAANVPEVLQSLLRRVQSLEEELKEYKKK